MLTTIPRTAAFSWGPGRQLVTGSDGALEIWDLLDYEHKAAGTATNAVTKTAKVKSSGADFFDDHEQDVGEEGLEQTFETVQDDSEGPKPRGAVKEAARFINVAWGASNVIAAGLEGGQLKLWDSSKILSNDGSNVLLATHTRPVHGLQFGPIQSHLLATGGGAGEVFIWDVNTPEGAPYAPTSGKADAEAVKWNRVVAHVLGGVGGSGAVVWDLRGKREVVRLPGGRMSDLEWSPDNATKLATACEDDASPVVQLWDLRHSRAPEKVFTHHTLGVRSLSWNVHDSTFLLSSGKDGRAVSFSSSTGEILGEVIGQGIISWSPTVPGIAAFAGESSVRILPSQNLEREEEEIGGGEDFFDVAGSEGEGLGLTKPGNWFGSRGGVSWGFSGRLVTWDQTTKTVKIRRAVWESEKVERAQRLVAAITKGNGEGGLKDLGVLSELFEGDVKTRVSKLLGTDETVSEEENDEEKEEDFFTNTHIDSEPYTIDTTEAVSGALVKGSLPRAVKACIQEGRWTEALLLATKGSPELLDETQKKYFARESALNTSSEALVKAVVRGEISDVVKRGEGWREVLSIASRFATKSEPKEETFSSLVDQMGERWEEEELWILGGRLDKLVNVWGAGDDGLDGLMERVAVFRGATGFVDHDLARSVPATVEEGEDTKPLKWKLAKLYDKYLEYVEVLVGQSKEEEARVFLEFVPAGYEGAVAVRERLGVKASPANVAAAAATSKPSVKAAYAPTTTNLKPAGPGAGAGFSSLPSQPKVSQPGYSQSNFTQPSYSQSNVLQSGYAQTGYQPTPNGATGRAYPVAPPSASTPYAPTGPYADTNASQPTASLPPPPKRDNGGWNDAPPPKTTAPPKARASTPKPITSPFPNSAPPYETPRPGSRGLASPPPPMGPPRGIISPPPPPPRGAGVPLRPDSTVQNPPPLGGRMTPQQTGPYAPPPGASHVLPPHGSNIARPPSVQLGAPQQGAFVAGGQFASPPPPSGFAPPPQAGGFAPSLTGPRGGFSVPQAGPLFIDGGAGASNAGPVPYAPQGSTTSPYAPPPSQGVYSPPASGQAQYGPSGHGGFNSGPPPPGPPPPSGGPATSVRPPPPPKKEEKKVIELKYPSGDRTHIPDRIREVYEVLEAELRRAPPNQFRELEKRLTPLFDGMNCETLSPATEDGLRAISQAIAARDRPAALALHVEMLTRGDGDVTWMSGVKQLIVRM